jgi:hypothetical protein
MIEQSVFKDTWAVLCERFNRDYSPAMATAYYQSLSARLDTEQFKAGVQRVFEQNEFFPKPADFFEVRDIKAESLEQWELISDVMRGFTPIASPALTEESRRVVRLLGGESKLRNTQLDEVQFVRRDFLQLYGDASEIADREHDRRISGGREARKIAAAVQIPGIE